MFNGKSLHGECTVFDENLPFQLAREGSGGRNCINRSQCEVLKAQRDQIRDQRKAAIKILSRTICHEINNPLSSVIGFSERLLKKDTLPKDLQWEISKIHENALQIQEAVRVLTLLKEERVMKMGKIPLLDLQETKKGPC